MMIASLMIDVLGATLTDEDRVLLVNPCVAGVILFGRNIQTPVQVRQLTDAIRTINPKLVIAVDQEGGRVARLKNHFTPLPAMGKLGKFYQKDSQQALQLATDIGYLMACEVLAVGIDFSFAPVLDIDNGSLVIGDRAFGQTIETASALAAAFIDGMNKAGMHATGKHFPGHGSVVPDSHVACAYDDRPFEQIACQDMQVFCDNLPKLAAVMPAHVVFGQVDDKPAGFSRIWLQEILRQQLRFDGVIFSDDLSMTAAKSAGAMDKRVVAALSAGCDVALICNDQKSIKQVLQNAKHLTASTNNQSATNQSANNQPTSNRQQSIQRLQRMKATFPLWQTDLTTTCQAFAHYNQSRHHVLAYDYTDAIFN